MSAHDEIDSILDAERAEARSERANWPPDLFDRLDAQDDARTADEAWAAEDDEDEL